MKEKPSKKVVIINDIASESIEQAIFILRNGGSFSSAGGTATVVQEAQRIINAYAETMETAHAKLSRREKKEKRRIILQKWGHILLALLPFITFGIGIGLAFYFF